MMGEIRKTVETSATGVVYDISQARRRLAPEPAPPADADHASIGDKARQVGQALSIVATSPEIRSERVAQLRASIAQGAYQPDPREIAREILARGL